MTRVNCIPVTELTNAHAMAEYREIPRLFKLARHGNDIPNSYRMGAGHVKFFYDKLGYIANRWRELRDELLARGYDLGYDYRQYVEGLIAAADNTLCGDWTPSESDMAVNLARIMERLGK